MARRFRVSFKKRVNIPRVVAKLTGVVIALYVGNEIINQIGTILNQTTGPFNTGFRLIGWDVGPSDGPACNTTEQATYVCGVNGAGVLTVVGVVGIASIIMEFINFSM